MKKILLTLLLLPVLNNCTQYSAMVGPSYSLMETGSILKATGSLSGALAMNNLKTNFANEIKNENICPIGPRFKKKGMSRASDFTIFPAFKCWINNK